MNYQQVGANARRFNQRMASIDPRWSTYMPIATGAVGATGAVSLLDLVLGDTNAFNSGEIPLNYMLSLAPILGGYYGGYMGHETFDNEANVERAKAQYAEDMKGAKDNLRGRTYENADERLKAQQEFSDRKNAAASKRDNSVNYGKMRRTARGAAIGAISGAVPAMLGMVDWTEA